MVEKKKVLAFEIAGMIFIILLGSALHFTYDLSGESPIVGIFSAVNESVWEHMKLAFWPSLFWLIIEFFPLKKNANNFFTAKAVGTYLMVFMIPLIFYSYTSITVKSIFAIDIASFVAAIIIGQILSYKLLTFRLLPRIGEGIAIILLILLGASFVIFTFYPPQLPIFQAPSEG